MTPLPTTAFLGIRFTALPFREVVDAVFAAANRPDFAYVITPNVDHLVQLDRGRADATGAAFAAAYRDAAMVLCDSRVLAGLARLSGKRLALVPGSDLTAALFADPRLHGRRVAVVGGSASLIPALTARYPSVDLVQHRPPMGILRDEAGMAAIERFVGQTGADLVIFAMGAPQSEVMARRCLQGGRARGLGLCSGAALEFIAGEKRRAPRWMRRLGIEWAHRLGSEPRRLWRRYLIEGPRVFRIWLRDGRD